MLHPLGSVGFEPTVPEHGFTIHRNNHSATTLSRPTEDSNSQLDG
jgi:hypothetical protein